METISYWILKEWGGRSPNSCDSLFGFGKVDLPQFAHLEKGNSLLPALENDGTAEGATGRRAV
jgi:hypothetical protein